MPGRLHHIRVPLGQSMQQVSQAKSADALQSLGRQLPCTVSKVIKSGIVEVNFEVNAGIFTLPKVIVPIEYPEYIRYPIQVGDKGYCKAATTRLGNMSGLGDGTPDLSTPGNLQGLVFSWIGNQNWVDPLDPKAVEIYGVDTSGVILRSGDSQTILTLKSDGIEIDLGGPITINTNGNDVNLNGGGNIVTDGDVIASDISLVNHVHGGVMSGSDDTDPPS